MIHHTYTFNQLPAHELMPYLVSLSKNQDLATLDRLMTPADRRINDGTNTTKTNVGDLWHICWLNNNSKPVIGLLPKTSWVVMPVSTNADDTNADINANAKAPSITTALNIGVTRSSRQAALMPSGNKVTPQLSNQATQAKAYDDNNDNAPQITTYTDTYDAWVKELINYTTLYSAHHDTHSSHCSATDLKADATYFEGFMGFIGYDIGAKALSPNNAHIQLANQPSAFIGHYDIFLTPNDDSQWQLHVKPETEPDAIDTVTAFLNQVEQHLSISLPTPSLRLDPTWDFDDYTDAFAKTQNFLYQGDSYQINLTQTWSGRRPSTDVLAANGKAQTADMVHYLPILHQNTKAPFAGYLAINSCSSDYSYNHDHDHDHDQYKDRDKENTQSQAKQVMPNLKINIARKTSENCTHSTLSKFDKARLFFRKGIGTDANAHLRFELLSCSPELFVVFHKDADGEHQILTKPIKGTLPRGATPKQDAELKQQLIDSEKDRAENVMIVDLLRNDLGRYAKTGSVQVPHLFEIESFSNVHHMVSSVTATIKDEVHPLTVLFDSLPAGSITGTPKKRAVEIIGELEAGPRGAYCGTLGFMNFDGSGQWNVLIRSLQANQAGEIQLWAGGGITVASQCESEYQECSDKVGNLIKLLKRSEQAS